MNNLIWILTIEYNSKYQMATTHQYDTNRLGYDLSFKMPIIGDAGVGKSSLLLRYADDVFSECYQNTIGVDFKIKTVEIDEKVIKLNLWDTAGKERFKAISSSFYRGAHGVVIVFDLTDKESFQNLGGWFEEIYKYSGQHVAKLLIGNKSDMKDKREVTYEIAQNFADQVGVPYLETSAKTASNVEQAFMTMTAEIKKVLGYDAFKNHHKTIKITEGRDVTENAWLDMCSC